MRFTEFKCANWRCRRTKRIAESEMRARKKNHERLGLTENYYCSKRCEQDSRRDKRAGIIPILLFLFCIPVLSQAAIIPMEVTAPCTNDDSLHTPLTDLKQINVWWQRCGRLDSLLVGIIPAQGRECDTLQFDLQVDSTGTTYDLWAYAEDMSGNKSILPIHWALVVPAEDYAYGLWGTYFADTTFTDFRYSKVDPNIDFDWGDGSPDPSVPVDEWAGRWTGKIRTLAGGTYSFRAYINNGFRMKIGGVPVIDGDSWTNPDTHNSLGSIQLSANTEYDFTADYRDSCCQAFIHLYWTPPGNVESIIPASAFVH